MQQSQNKNPKNPGKNSVVEEGKKKKKSTLGLILIIILLTIVIAIGAIILQGFEMI